MPSGHPAKANRSHIVDYKIRILGANGADATVQEGVGVTSVARTGEGAYTITFSKDPGLFVGWSIDFGAATPADLAGYTGVRGVYSASARTLAFVVYNSSFAAADLIADQYADITVSFSEYGN